MQNEYSIGVDIGGTKMNAILWNGEKIIADYKLNTPKNDFNEFISMFCALIDPLIVRAKNDKVKIAGIGIGIASALDLKKETILTAPNIPGIQRKKLAKEVEKKTGIKTVMENDTRCFTIAEARFGAGKKYDNIYGIILGTGIGGAWYSGGHIHEGAHGGAGEPGAITIDFTSGIRIEEAYHQLMQSNPAKFAEEAYRGDELAQKKFDEFGKMLGMLFANITNVLDPHVFVIGGGASESSSLFLATAQKTMCEYIESTDSKKTKILVSKLGRHAGAIGAALLI